MRTAKEILCEVFEAYGDDLQLNITLNPSVSLIEQAMEAYHEDKTRWISVEERLPEVDNKANPFGERIDCLVVYDGYVYKGQYMNVCEPFWSVSHICSSSSLNVTKWMLLPKP